MDDLDDSGSPVLNGGEEPQGNADPGDMLNPDIEEEHSPNAPIADPTADPDAADSDAPEDQPVPDGDPAFGADDDDDDDSELEELDEAQFEDFDPEAANIVVPDQPVAVDESNVGLLGVHKRKRTEEEERERKKKKKEGRRARESKRPKKRGEGADGVEDGATSSGRTIKGPRRAASPVDEETLTPEERRRRALERKMEEALRSNKPARRRIAGIDLQDMGEEELNIMRNKMATAAQLDNEARKRNEPASHKLKILPAVTELLNRNTLRQAILDPDINVLEAVRFFLEPADEDAALPNYQIQREMFAVLSKLRMTKEALIASGIGKVVMYYTKSTQPQPVIKRQAEKLIQGWMSVVLNKRHSSKMKQVETRAYDPVAASQRAVANASQLGRIAAAEEKRRKALQVHVPGNRARIEGGLNTYTVAPVSMATTQAQSSGRMGGRGDDVVKKLALKSQQRAGKK